MIDPQQSDDSSSDCWFTRDVWFYYEGLGFPEREREREREITQSERESNREEFQVVSERFIRSAVN